MDWEMTGAHDDVGLRQTRPSSRFGRPLECASRVIPIALEQWSDIVLAVFVMRPASAEATVTILRASPRFASHFDGVAPDAGAPPAKPAFFATFRRLPTALSRSILGAHPR